MSSLFMSTYQIMARVDSNGTISPEDDGLFRRRRFLFSLDDLESAHEVWSVYDHERSYTAIVLISGRRLIIDEDFNGFCETIASGGAEEADGEDDIGPYQFITLKNYLN